MSKNSLNNTDRPLIKFGLSEKHTKFEKIFLMVLTNQLIYLENVKTMRKIFSDHVYFSKSLNFTIQSILNFQIRQKLFFKVLLYECPLRHMTDSSLQSIGIIIHVIALLEFFIKHHSNIFKDWINSLVCINSNHSIQYLQKIFEVCNSNLKPRMVCRPTWFFFMVVICKYLGDMYYRVCHIFLNFKVSRYIEGYNFWSI